jgi:hypothetical protein
MQTVDRADVAPAKTNESPDREAVQRPAVDAPASADHVASELRPWLRDALGGLASAPSTVIDAAVASLPLGAREELAAHRVIVDSGARSANGEAVLTQFGLEVLSACADARANEGASHEHERAVEDALEWLDEDTRSWESAHMAPPSARRRH